MTGGGRDGGAGGCSGEMPEQHGRETEKPLKQEEAVGGFEGHMRHKGCGLDHPILEHGQ